MCKKEKGLTLSTFLKYILKSVTVNVPLIAPINGQIYMTSLAGKNKDLLMLVIPTQDLSSYKYTHVNTYAIFYTRKVLSFQMPFLLWHLHGITGFGKQNMK